MKIRYCNKCGASIQPNGKFCEKCGNRIRQIK
ncbi:MAG: zinc-ribbon domain-containing protein [Promethearchaeota archaeon]